MASSVDHVMPWPSALEDIKRFVQLIYEDLEGQRSQCLLWGEPESGVPTYAALGLPGAFTAWFIDLLSVESITQLMAKEGAAHSLHEDHSAATGEQLVTSRLRPVLVALPCHVPGITVDLEAASIDRVARALAMDVVGLERAGLSHARCLAMMLGSSSHSTSPATKRGEARRRAS
jgi:hypothetical protein